MCMYMAKFEKVYGLFKKYIFQEKVVFYVILRTPILIINDVLHQILSFIMFYEYDLVPF